MVHDGRDHRKTRKERPIHIRVIDRRYKLVPITIALTAIRPGRSARGVVKRNRFENWRSRIAPAVQIGPARLGLLRSARWARERRAATQLCRFAHADAVPCNLAAEWINLANGLAAVIQAAARPALNIARVIVGIAANWRPRAASQCRVVRVVIAAARQTIV